MALNQAAIDAAVATERERCAKVCEEEALRVWSGRGWSQKRAAAARLAQLIRGAASDAHLQLPCGDICAGAARDGLECSPGRCAARERPNAAANRLAEGKSG